MGVWWESSAARLGGQRGTKRASPPVDSEGGLERIRVSFCVRDCRRKCSHLSHGHPVSSVECPVSPGGDMVRTSMIHAVWQRFIWAVGSGRARKSIETAWAVRLDVGVSASGVDSQRDSTA